MSFRARSEHDLARMSEDQRIAYLLAARRAGDRDASGLAVAMLVHGLMGTVEARVAMRVPKEAVDDVAKAVLLSALNSAFDGSTVGEFRGWLNVILKRRVADYHRDPKRDVRTVPLPTEHQGEDDVWGEEPATEPEGDTIDIRRALDQAYNELNPIHQRVVEIIIFLDRPPAEAVEETGVGENNAHQIVSRFRRRVEELLPDDGDTSG